MFGASFPGKLDERGASGGSKSACLLRFANPRSLSGSVVIISGALHPSGAKSIIPMQKPVGIVLALRAGVSSGSLQKKIGGIYHGRKTHGGFRNFP
jgi:hypothetical protein